jgi:hypothetical protein
VAVKKEAPKEEPKEEVEEPPKKTGSGFFGFGTAKVRCSSVGSVGVWAADTVAG